MGLNVQPLDEYNDTEIQELWGTLTKDLNRGRLNALIQGAYPATPKERRIKDVADVMSSRRIWESNAAF